ncbi:MAG: hypothetical protein JXB24_15520 [Bacteroidales bacterium]|nr:hypothetical protein [Bacteroidales bacterium]
MSAKKYIRILFFFVVCFIMQYSQTICQENDEFIAVDVKLWNSDGDTLYGTIDYINQYNLQFSVSLIDTNGNVIKYYSPRDIDGFCFVLNDEKAVFHSVENPLNIGMVFLLLIYEGKYSVYRYLELNQRSSIFSFIPHYYLWSENRWLEPEITKPFEKEALLYHFADCPELEYKIKTGEYGLNSIGTIIEEYEECELTDEYEFFFE